MQFIRNCLHICGGFIQVMLVSKVQNSKEVDDLSVLTFCPVKLIFSK